MIFRISPTHQFNEKFTRPLLDTSFFPLPSENNHHEGVESQRKKKIIQNFARRIGGGWTRKGEEVEATKERRLYRDIRERTVRGTAYGTTFPPIRNIRPGKQKSNTYLSVAAAAARITGYGHEG